MSSKIEAFFAAVRKEKAILDKTSPSGCVFTYSLDNLTRGSTSNTVTEVSNRLAAEALVNGVARLATEAEVAAHRARAASFAARMNAMTEGHRDQTKIFVTLTTETDGAN